MDDAPDVGTDTVAPHKVPLICRSEVLRALRTFFYRHDFIEVETPVRLRAPALETHIDAEPTGTCYLRTSPELHMKRLLAAGFPRIFQIGPCFRKDERGPFHHPEYTMLEWYRARGDYMDILADTEALIREVARAVKGDASWTWQGRRVNATKEWRVMTVESAFTRWAGWNPVTHMDEDRFDLDLVDKIEPELSAIDVPVILKNYPAAAAALARRQPHRPEVAERWELYIAGIEIANAYSELTDPDEQRARFEAAARHRQQAGRPVYPIDEDFLAALPHLPPCGGIALGVDRLVMLLADTPDINGVTAFQEH
jgi:elongation factor P--(R)-beta-lysine ligase